MPEATLTVWDEAECPVSTRPRSTACRRQLDLRLRAGAGSLPSRRLLGRRARVRVPSRAVETPSPAPRAGG